MNERVRMVRDKLDFSRSSFGEKLGVSGDVINNLERGRVEIKESMIKLICSVFSVNETWLRTGKGEMFDQNPASELEALAKKYELSHDARVLVEEFVNLKPEMQRVFIDFARKAAESFRSEPTAPNQTSTDTDGQSRTKPNIMSELAELRRQNAEIQRQNQELSARLSAMEEEEDLLWPSDTGNLA